MTTPILIRGGLVVDGSGGKPYHANVLLTNDTITAIGKDLRSAEGFIEAEGKVVAPGFIDTHSHADGGLLESPEAETQIRQGITTAVVGQDGGSKIPLADWFKSVEAKRVALNVASFVGHGSVRRQVLGDDYKRAAIPAEVKRMQMLVADEMQAGALGLSSGLEYEPGLFSETSELIALAQAAGRYGGLYISHVRDEEDDALTSFRELIQIAEAAKIPAQVSHIKLASSPVWGKTGDVFRLMDAARSRGLDITADVYPYTYWQSNIVTLVPGKSDVKNDREVWTRAIAQIGGPTNVLFTGAEGGPTWQGKTLAQISAAAGKNASDIVLDLMARTDGKGATVVVTAMREADVRAFIAHPRIMFCTDGGLRSSHPRGAGSYPRIFGKYVREDRVLSLESAVHKATALPAARMGFADRGRIAPGMKADIVLFDPKTIHDTATTRDPRSAPVGLTDVLVNGIPVLQGGKITDARPGMAIRRSRR